MVGCSVVAVSGLVKPPRLDSRPDRATIAAIALGNPERKEQSAAMMKSVIVGGQRLAVEDCGSGRAVLLVHGFPLDHSMWDAQIETLSRHYRVIAPDLRGFGRSDPLPANCTAVTMARLADDLAELLAALAVEGPVAVCGLSMGGYIAWEFWRRHRVRLGKLILCDTRAAPDPPEAAATRFQNAARALAEGTGFLADTLLPRLVAPQTLQANAEIVARLRQMMADVPSRTVAAVLRGMACRSDARAWLGAIACPTLVLVGQHDAISPPDEMRSIAAQIPHARFEIIPGAGHMAPMENPSATNAALLSILAS